VDGDRLADPARLTAVATLGATARSCDLNAQNSYNLSENTGHLGHSRLERSHPRPRWR
jgi:hypothetical protein